MGGGKKQKPVKHSPDSYPVTGGAATERENLAVEVKQLQLLALKIPRIQLCKTIPLPRSLRYFSLVPRSHGVVQAAGPQFETVGRQVDAARAVRVSLELPGRID